MAGCVDGEEDLWVAGGGDDLSAAREGDDSIVPALHDHERGVDLLNFGRGIELATHEQV